MDGDLTDEWIRAHRGVIGDLAFKPLDNQIAEWGARSAFVHKVYQEVLA